MPGNDPSNYSMLTYMWVLGLSAWGSLVQVIRRATDQELTLKMKLQFIIAEVTISTFAGMVTFFLCEWAQMDKMLSAAFIAISGHMGARAIILTEKMFVKFIEGRTP
jgi:hypothetical protein